MKSTYNINYKLPLNFKSEWSHLFKPDNKYKTVDLQVKELKNVFVNHYGTVVKNGLLVPGCAPNIGVSTYDENFYYSHWRKATEQFLVCKYGKSLPSIKLDDSKKYLLIHSPWFSYYFWVTECIPRLLMVKDQLDDLILIYPEKWNNLTFVNETLELFPNIQKEVIPTDSHLFVKNLIMPEVKPWTPMFIPEQIFETRELLLGALQTKNIDLNFGDNVYISRSKAQRTFHDIENTEKQLNDIGFSTFIPENHSFFEQIHIMNNANNVLSITGAGVTNVLFKKPGGCFIDMPNEQYKDYKLYKFHFWKLCCILGIDYIAQFCKNPEFESQEKNDYKNQKLLLDFDALAKNLQLIK